MCDSFAGRLALFATILLSRTLPAAAYDATVPGRMLLLKNIPSGNMVVYKVNFAAIAGFNLGDTGDPTCSGAGGGGGSLRVNGGVGNDFTIPLPCAGWRHLDQSSINPDYKYQDTTGATCRTIIVRHGTIIRLKCKGPQVAYTLGQAQGDIDVTLRVGSGPDRNCSTFGPPPTRVLADGSNGRTYLAKDAPGPASCTSP